MKTRTLFEVEKQKENTCGEPIFKQTDWLVSACLVGLLKVLKEFEYPIEEYAEGKTVKIPKEVWEELPKLYAEYIWKISGGKSSSIFGLLKTFYNNSRLAQIFQKDVKQTLEKIVGLDTKKEEIKRYISTLGDKNQFQNLKKEIFEFDPKFVDENFITFAVSNEVLNLLNKLEEKLSKAQQKEKKELLNQIRENELKKELNEKGKVANRKIILEAIKKELRKVLKHQCDTDAPICRFCFTRHAYRKEEGIKALEETNFSPLFASSKTLENFFYDGKNALFLCPYCEFLLYFAGFSFNKTPNGSYIFVYIPYDVLTTLELNEILQTKNFLTKEFIKESLTEIAKKLEETKSEWLLSNIFFVEIEPVSQNTANIYTFHIPLKVAEVIKHTNLPKKFPKDLNPIFDIFLDYTFSGRSLYHLLLLLISYYFQKVEKVKGNSFAERIIKTAKFIKSELESLPFGLTFLIPFEELLKEGLNMEETIKKQINWAFAEGKKVRATLKELYPERFEKKIETASFRILEAIRRRDIDAFAQNLIRLYLDIEKPIPKLFVDALDEKQFNRIAYAFLIGLNNEKEPKGEQNNEQPAEVGELN